jgi:hypothetical protein
VESLPSKRRILKKREKVEGSKSKRGKTSFEKLQISKREREDEIYKLFGEILLKKERKETTFFL